MPHSSSHSAPIAKCIVSNKREDNRILSAYHGLYNATKYELRQTVKIR